MKIAQRGNTNFRINPISAKFDECILIYGEQIEFKSKKSRLFNQSYISQAYLGSEKKLSLRHKFKEIIIHGENLVNTIVVVPPLLFPFFSVGFFLLKLPEGDVRVAISRDSQKVSFGNIAFKEKNYRYLYKQFYYRSEIFMDMFPDSLPNELSQQSIHILVFTCLWINAYNAPSVV